MEAGVLGFLVKPLRPEELGPALDVAVSRFREHEAVRKENEALKQKLEARKLVDRAKGVLMTRLGLSEPEASVVSRRRPWIRARPWPMWPGPCFSPTGLVLFVPPANSAVF